jgi:P pilus assembly chaperone PapD
MFIDFASQRKLQLRISKMQIDNQTPYDATLPVILFSKNMKTKDEDTVVKPFFNLNITM